MSTLKWRITSRPLSQRRPTPNETTTRDSHLHIQICIFMHHYDAIINYSIIQYFIAIVFDGRWCSAGDLLRFFFKTNLFTEETAGAIPTLASSWSIIIIIVSKFFYSSLSKISGNIRQWGSLPPPCCLAAIPTAAWRQFMAILFDLITATYLDFR